MSFNYNKLRGRIIEKYSTIGKFADALGITFESLSKKLNNKVAFSQKEIKRICELLEIADGEVGVYFFTLEVQNIELDG